MQPAQSRIKFTYQDYLLTPDDKRYELIEGDLYMTPSPTSRHQIISLNLCFYLKEYILKRGAGTVIAAPMDVVLSDEDVFQPDILLISPERQGIIKPENIQGAPDLVIEILSPSTTSRDLVIKKKLYAKYAVREYWIVNPDQQTIEVMSWSEEGFKTIQVYPGESILHSPVLPGFSLALPEVFA